MTATEARWVKLVVGYCALRVVAYNRIPTTFEAQLTARICESLGWPPPPHSLHYSAVAADVEKALYPVLGVDDA